MFRNQASEQPDWLGGGDRADPGNSSGVQATPDKRMQQAARDAEIKEREGMSFQQQPPGDSQYQEGPPMNPFLSPPPASAPPPPPPSDSDSGSVRSVNLKDDESAGSSSGPTVATPNSYQGKLPETTSPWAGSSSYYSSYHNARAAPVPMITNYGVSPQQTYYPSQSLKGESIPTPNPSVLRGDPSVRPNTGQTNDEYGGIGSLQEVTSRLRWMTIGSSLAALIWEGFAFPERLLINSWDHPAKVVLGAYLAFFCFLLLGVELNAPLRENLGVLYHPLGRASVLFLLASMSFGIHIAWWELLLSAAFTACSIGYIYAYIKYPEYRRWQDYNDNRIWRDMGQAIRNRSGNSVDWADPEGSIMASRTWRATQEETQSLLHQV